MRRIASLERCDLPFTYLSTPSSFRIVSVSALVPVQPISLLMLGAFACAC